MSLTINTKSFDKDIQLQNVVGIRYNGPNHGSSHKEYADLIRVDANSNAAQPKSKTKARLVKTATDGTDPLTDALAELNVQLPVGMDATERTSFIADIVSLFGNSTYMTALIEDLDLDQ